MDSRRYPERSFEQAHLRLSELKKLKNVDNSYLLKTITPYPKPVLFRISKVSHVTGQTGLRGIIEDGGFRKPSCLGTNDNFLWWNLSVTENEIASADSRFLRWSYGDVAPNQPPFLEKFTTSPAFQSESRYGNFRFTFPFRKLLRLYAKKYCNDSAPVLRVLRTDLYKKEILYAVLVHPRHVEIYRQYPRLPWCAGDGVCGYGRGRIFWLCQSPSDSYHYQMKMDEQEEVMWAEELHSPKYYVWDHVAVAFHMEPGWILDVGKERLFHSVSVCKITEPCLLRKPDTPLTKKDAEKMLEKLKLRYLY